MTPFLPFTQKKIHSPNTSGFSALLAGVRDYYGFFGYLGSYTYFWSSTESYATYAYFMYLSNYDSAIHSYDIYKGNGFSVRCAKDF